MNFKKKLSPLEPLLYNTQLPIYSVVRQNMEISAIVTVRPSPYVVFAQKRALRELSLSQILHLQTTSRELFSRTSMLGALSQSCEESRPTAPTSKETARTRKSGDQEQNHFRKLQ